MTKTDIYLNPNEFVRIDVLPNGLSNGEVLSIIQDGRGSLFVKYRQKEILNVKSWNSG